MSPKVFLGLPIYGDISPQVAGVLLRFMAQPPCQMEVGMEIGSQIQVARNNLTAKFLSGDYTHLLFMDSDMLPTAMHVKTLLSRKMPIVAGICPKKKDGDLEWALQPSKDAPGPLLAGSELLKVDYVGSGFMLIERNVFETVLDLFGPEITFDSDDGPAHDFWAQGIYPRPIEGKRMWLGEDWAFCQRARDCGFEVWADTKVVVPHIGRAIYPMHHQREALVKSGIGSLTGCQVQDGSRSTSWDRNRMGCRE